MNRRDALKSLGALTVAVTGCGIASSQPAWTPAQKQIWREQWQGFVLVTNELLEDSTIDLGRFQYVAYDDELHMWELLA